MGELDPEERTTVTITCRDFKDVEHCEDCHQLGEGSLYVLLTCTRPLPTFDVVCRYCCLSFCSLLSDDAWVEALHETNRKWLKIYLDKKKGEDE